MSIVAKALFALEELKATEIKNFDVSCLTSMTDRMIIATGNSNRHVNAIAENIIKQLCAEFTLFNLEGMDTAEWVVLNFGDLIIHILQPSTRAYYNLDKLWDPALSFAELEELAS